MKTDYLKILILLLLISGISISCRDEEENLSRENNPNIILIMCDDLGWGDVGFNGNKIIKTPNLDMLAGKGITFNRFYSASAVCSPTRGSCLTGRNSYRYGIPRANSGHLKKEEITLPEFLKEKGYSTGHFGKWHLGTLTTKINDANRGRPGDSAHYSIPSMHGYDSWFVTESKVPTYDPMLKPEQFDTLNGENLHFGWKAIIDISEAKSYGTFYWNDKETIADENLQGDDSKIIVDRVIPFFEKAVEKEQPFFSVVWFHTPHLPVVANDEMMRDYKRFSHREQLYYGAITAMDEQVGRIWKKLEELGQADNTMIWFCSDNGPAMQTPGSAGIFRKRKFSLYEGGVRVPAFCVWPGKIKSGKFTEFPAFTSDYLPTILSVIDIDFPDNRPLDGVDLTEVLKGKKNIREKPMGFQFKEKVSWVTQKYKLISTDDGETFELYDLINDKQEKNNIAGENSGMVQKMKNELLAWMESCKNSEQGADY